MKFQTIQPVTHLLMILMIYSYRLVTVFWLLLFYYWIGTLHVNDHVIQDYFIYLHFFIILVSSFGTSTITFVFKLLRSEIVYHFS